MKIYSVSEMPASEYMFLKLYRKAVCGCKARPGVLNSIEKDEFAAICLHV